MSEEDRLVTQCWAGRVLRRVMVLEIGSFWGRACARLCAFYQSICYK